jgi:hypothetical protein
VRTEACWECGKNEEVHYHHVVPRSKGGTRTLPLCLECHGKVHNKKMHSSELVKASYARRRKQNPGVKFGADAAQIKKMVEASAIVRTEQAIEFEQMVIHYDLILNQDGYKTQQQKCDRLNELGIKTRTGKLWSQPGFNRTLKRAKRRESPVTPSEG